MTKLVHFETLATDVDALAQFYCDVFGWTTIQSEFVPDYTMLETGDAGRGGAVVGRRYAQGQPSILWFEVDSIEGIVGKVVASGGRQVNAVQEMPGVGLLVYVADPEGTVFGLKQPEASL